MRYIIGLSLLLLGLFIGLLGDVPLNSVVYTQLELIVVGGVLIAGGVALLLITAAQRGSRQDEPQGHIRP